jgi:hypothetical protein
MCIYCSTVLVLVNQKSLSGWFIFAVNIQQGSIYMANLVAVKIGNNWTVVNADTQVPVAGFIDQQSAELFVAENNDSLAAVAQAEARLITAQGGIDTDPGPVTNTSGYGEEDEPLDFDNIAISPGGYTPAQLNEIARAQGVDTGEETDPFSPNIVSEQDLYDQEAADRNALITNARQQQTIAQQRRQINNGDWRVRLRLAPASKYLYNAPNPGILQPLQVTDGIIFPYTPTISTVYKADYDGYALTHSNYKGYFYKSSYVDTISLRCTFTAQGTSEANYLLAVITFLKSATKMFYGQDAERGAPPPLVYLSGLGDYQFNEHSCVITQFDYSLPGDVDYIRAGSANQPGINLSSQRDRQSVSNSNFAGFGRLLGLLAQGIGPGAESSPPPPPTLGLNRPTYVPTKMEISLSLLPIQSRSQVSKQFSLKEFANGNLIRGGFW